MDHTIAVLLGNIRGIKNMAHYGNYVFNPVPFLEINSEQIEDPGGSALSIETTYTLNGRVMGRGIWETLENASGLHSGIMAQPYANLVIGGVDAYSVGVESLNFAPTDDRWTQSIDYTLVFKKVVPVDGSQTKVNHMLGAVQNSYDTYTIVTNDDYASDPYYAITRKVGAQGLRTANSGDAIYAARKWVSGHLYDSPFSTSYDQGIEPHHLKLFNRDIQLEVDEAAGKFGFTETYISKSGSPYLLDIKPTVQTEGTTGKLTIKIAGTIEGLQPASGTAHNDAIFSGLIHTVQTYNLPKSYPSGKYMLQPIDYDLPIGSEDTLFQYVEYEANNSVTEKIMSKYAFANAKDGYDYVSRALSFDPSSVGQNQQPRYICIKDFLRYNTLVSGQQYGNHMVNFYPQLKNPENINLKLEQSTSAYFPNEGKITFDKSYTNMPESIMTGAITDKLVFSNNDITIRTKKIPVLGRKIGPVVFNYYNSQQPGVFKVVYEGTFPKPTGLKKYGFPPQILQALDDLLDSYAPANNQTHTAFLKEDKEDWNPTTNKITKTKSWEYSKCE